MSIKYNRKNIILAKNLRKNATRQEKHLWYDFLSTYNPPFQRQKAIDNFIVDFYCDKACLIIELDGSQHDTFQKNREDIFRTEVLQEYGMNVIRFDNACLDQNFKGVCEYIDQTVKQILGSDSSNCK